MSASTCARRSRPSTAPACCIATSRRRTSCARTAGALVLMDFGTGEEIEDQDASSRRDADLSLAGGHRARPGVSAERSLCRRRAAVLRGDGRVPGRRRFAGRPGAGASRRPASHRSRRPARRFRQRWPVWSIARSRRIRAGAMRARRRWSRRCARRWTQLPGQRVLDGIAQWGLVATMMAAIVVLVAMLIANAPSRSPSSTISTLCRAAASLRVRRGRRAVPGGRTHRSADHDTRPDSLAQGHRADVGRAVQGDRRSGRRDCPSARRGWHRRRDGAGAERDGESTGACARQRPVDQGGDGPGHLVGFARASTGRHARPRVGAGQDDCSSNAWRADAGRECAPCLPRRRPIPPPNRRTSRDERISRCSRRTRSTRWRRSSGRSPSILITERRTPALPGATWRLGFARVISQPRREPRPSRRRHVRSRSTTGWPKRTECSATSSFSTIGIGPGRSASTGARSSSAPAPPTYAASMRSSWRRWGARKRPGCRPRTPRV